MAASSDGETRLLAELQFTLVELAHLVIAGTMTDASWDQDGRRAGGARAVFLAQGEEVT